MTSAYKHGSVLLYVHRNCKGSLGRKAQDGPPRLSHSSLTVMDLYIYISMAGAVRTCHTKAVIIMA